MNFGTIDRVILFGGSQLMAALCYQLSEQGMETVIFTGERHLNDYSPAHGKTIKAIAEELNIPNFASDDINDDPRLVDYITPQTLGLALGASWIFEPDTAALFDGKLLDFMGINLPQYRGGAHYTWQILRGNRTGACNLQVIYGGAQTFHRGEIIKHQSYTFPLSARTPQDYFDAAIPHEIAFLAEFFAQLSQQTTFIPQVLQEQFSSYYPFLHTLEHGYIDWSWDTLDIERFICAFDEPYAGASSFLNGERLFFKSCYAELSAGIFHPFHAGLVIHKNDREIHIATKQGVIAVQQVTNSQGDSMMDTIQLGDRIYTPQAQLEQAMQRAIVYDAGGVKKSDANSE